MGLSLCRRSWGVMGGLKLTFRLEMMRLLEMWLGNGCVPVVAFNKDSLSEE